MFENHSKSLIQHCERSELPLHFEYLDKSLLKMPDRSILIWQKFVENAKVEKLKYDILGDFYTLCHRHKDKNCRNSISIFLKF